MGGPGSGQWRTARYPTMEDSCVLDIAHICRCGGLRRGVIVASTLRCWPLEFSVRIGHMED